MSGLYYFIILLVQLIYLGVCTRSARQCLSMKMWWFFEVKKTLKFPICRRLTFHTNYDALHPNPCYSRMLISVWMSFCCTLQESAYLLTIIKGWKALQELVLVEELLHSVLTCGFIQVRDLSSLFFEVQCPTACTAVRRTEETSARTVLVGKVQIPFFRGKKKISEELISVHNFIFDYWKHWKCVFICLKMELSLFKNKNSFIPSPFFFAQSWTGDPNSWESVE